MEKTAIEWLIKELKDMEYDLRLIPNIIKKAKELDKQQKHSEYMRGWKDGLSCKSIKNKIK